MYQTEPKVSSGSKEQTSHIEMRKKQGCADGGHEITGEIAVARIGFVPLERQSAALRFWVQIIEGLD